MRRTQQHVYIDDAENEFNNNNSIHKKETQANNETTNVHLLETEFP